MYTLSNVIIAKVLCYMIIIHWAVAKPMAWKFRQDIPDLAKLVQTYTAMKQKYRCLEQLKHEEETIKVQ